jgi:hypothetical protein
MFYYIASDKNGEMYQRSYSVINHRRSLVDDQQLVKFINIFQPGSILPFKKKIIFVTESIFYKFYYFPKFSFSAQNLFLLSILQHVIASKSNHINTILPNEMVGKWRHVRGKQVTLHFKSCGLKKYGKMKCLMTSCTRKTSNVISYMRFTEFW